MNQILSREEKWLKSKYTFLFAALLLWLIATPYVSHSYIYNLVNTLTFFTIFLAGIYCETHNKKVAFGYILFFIFYLTLRIIYLLYLNNIILILSKILFFVFIFKVIISYLKDILNKKIINRDIIIGSICIYLLIGLLFGLFYDIFNDIAGQSIQHSANLAIDKFDFYYFSYIALTTVGFGDIFVVSPYLKPIIILECVTGVFYIAIIVARLVVMFS